MREIDPCLLLADAVEASLKRRLERDELIRAQRGDVLPLQTPASMKNRPSMAAVKGRAWCSWSSFPRRRPELDLHGVVLLLDPVDLGVQPLVRRREGRDERPRGSEAARCELMRKRENQR